jgi:hypothetical protein
MVPSGYLDFGIPPRGEDRPLEAYLALLMLRRALSGGNLKFPLNDFAIVWYLYRRTILHNKTRGTECQNHKPKKDER